jgi:hypothetical protein
MSSASEIRATQQLTSCHARRRGRGTGDLRGQLLRCSRRGRIELDLRPSGCFARAFVGTDRDDKPVYEERELDEGDVIAHGTTDVEGYGTTPVERAKFIVDTIRLHLAREACKLHAEDLSSIEALLGREVRWCPSCGTRLSTD